MRASELSLVGHIAEQSLREVRVDKVVMGMRAISLEAGMTNDYLPEVMTRSKYIFMSPRRVITQPVAGWMFSGSQPSSPRAVPARASSPEWLFSTWDAPGTGAGSNG